MRTIQTEFHVIHDIDHESQMGRVAKPYLIAEIGLNHNGNLDLAIEMLKAAKASGAQCAKFQYYKSEYFIDSNAKLGDQGPGSLMNFFRTFELTKADWIKLRNQAREEQIDFLCSVFDSQSLKDYIDLKPWGIKLASCDITNYRLFKESANTSLPVLFSTGTANEREIAQAVRWMHEGVFAILECVSSYPANPTDYDLSLIPKWKQNFDCITGISDHTLSNSVSLAATAFGASIIERHFTLDKTMEGPDQSISLDPKEFADLAKGVGEVQMAKGNGLKKSRESEEGPKKYGRRSLYATRDINSGEEYVPESLIALRPDLGIPANEEPALLGEKAYRTFKKGEAVERPPIVPKNQE